MRIGELASLVGISTRAIRHYHRVGLMALLETAAPALDTGARGTAWLGVLTRTLNSDPGVGPAGGPVPRRRP